MTILFNEHWRIQDFLDEKGANPQGGGHTNLLFDQIYPKNCMKNERNWTQREGASLASPLDPPMMTEVKFIISSNTGYYVKPK